LGLFTSPGRIKETFFMRSEDFDSDRHYFKLYFMIKEEDEQVEDGVYYIAEEHGAISSDMGKLAIVFVPRTYLKMWVEMEGRDGC